MNTPITYYGQSTLPRVATTYTLERSARAPGPAGVVRADEPDRAAVEQETRLNAASSARVRGLSTNVGCRSQPSRLRS
jgi:hypothetical protein